MPVDEVFQVKGAGLVVCGTIQYGEVRPGDRVVVAPSGRVTLVASVEVFHRNVARAGPGDDVGLCLHGLDRRSANILKGSVVSHARCCIQ